MLTRWAWWFPGTFRFALAPQQSAAAASKPHVRTQQRPTTHTGGDSQQLQNQDPRHRHPFLLRPHREGYQERREQAGGARHQGRGAQGRGQSGKSTQHSYRRCCADPFEEVVRAVDYGSELFESI